MNEYNAFTKTQNSYIIKALYRLDLLGGDSIIARR